MTAIAVRIITTAQTGVITTMQAITDTIGVKEAIATTITATTVSMIQDMDITCAVTDVITTATCIGAMMDTITIMTTTITTITTNTGSITMTTPMIQAQDATTTMMELMTVANIPTVTTRQIIG